MSDEFNQTHEESYSSFWPVFILLLALITWFGLQDFQLIRQRAAFQTQLDNAGPTLTDAGNISNRYVSLMQDLVQTAQKDTVATQIVKDAIAGGLIKVNQGTNAAGTPAAPTSSSDSSSSTH